MRNFHGILRKFAYFAVILTGILRKFGYFAITGFNENHLKIQDGCKIEHGLCLHLYCLAIFYVYRDTIAAPGPVSLFSYVEKLITAGTREGMSYGDTKSHATKVNLRTGTLSKNKNTVSTAWVHAPIITTKMTVVQTLQTADLVLLIIS